jgi:Bacterial membrane protein YfhO
LASTVAREHDTRSSRTIGGIPAADARAVAVLIGLTVIVAWNRFAFDTWLARFDLFTFFVPWYDFLGQRLRAGEIPGWNPSLFSGTPFAGDPASGWMYVPAMLFLPLLPVLSAFKAMVAFQLGVAGLSTYAFARALGMGAIAALVGAVVYLFGPFLQWNTYCCQVFSEFAAWIPLALLGVELALRARRWRDRIAPWFATGFAISQMFAGWVGEGWLYAVLLVAAYTGYRALLSPPRPDSPRARVMVGAATVGAVFGLGLALGAAGILPRVAVNAETNLAGARYGELGAEGILNPPWRLGYLLVQILGNGYDERRAALGGAAIVLSLLAPAVAGRRFAVPFFAVVTLVALTLALNTTPVHSLFYLIPRYRELHEHDPWRSVAMAPFGPAILSAATVESLASWRGRRRLLPVVVAPLLAVAVVAVVLWRVEEFVGWPSLLAAAATTALVAIAVARGSGGGAGAAVDHVVPLVAGLVVAVAFVQPTGLELTGSWLGWPRAPTWERHWHPDPLVARSLANEVSRTDPEGAGGFLQAQLAADGPFRYLGYGAPGPSYMSLRFESGIQAILVNGRPMILGLDEIQGYNPLQLARYVEFMNAVNGTRQNYHVAYVLPSGVRSPLLDLLDVRYVLVDATLPQDRDDVVALTQGRQEVFRTNSVIVYERQPAPAHAWIVHDVRSVARDEALPLLTGGTVDPYRTALVEGTPPAVAPADGSAVETARVTRYEPDALTVAATATAPGLLVASEVYDPGWRAYVDGKRVGLLPTDHVLRGVPIPAGAHTVEMRYEPPSLRLGLPVSAIATLAMLVAFAAAGWTWLRRGRRAGPPGSA